MSPRPDEIFEAADVTSKVNRLVGPALSAALECDEDRARRLSKRLKALIAEAEAKLAAAPAQARAFYHTDDVVERHLKAARKALKRIRKLLKVCRKKAGKPPKKVGSFKGTTQHTAPTIGNDSIDFVFEFKKPVRCERLCLVSVYYIENDETGEILRNPSDGYLEGFDNFGGGTLSDDHAVDGRIVDAPVLRKPEGGGDPVKSNNPCLPTSKVEGQKVIGYDPPNFVKRGFTAYFETCVVCLDDRPRFKVLGSMRWSNKGNTSALTPRKGRLDRERRSDGFIRALEKYLALNP